MERFKFRNFLKELILGEDVPQMEQVGEDIRKYIETDEYIKKPEEDLLEYWRSAQVDAAKFLVFKDHLDLISAEIVAETVQSNMNAFAKAGMPPQGKELEINPKKEIEANINVNKRDSKYKDAFNELTSITSRLQNSYRRHIRVNNPDLTQENVALETSSVVARTLRRVMQEGD
jgi:hypothetical protein